MCSLLSDTDVFLLLIHFYPSYVPLQGLEQVLVHTYVRNIDIQKIYEYIGPRHTQAITGFQVFTDWDNTSKFYGKSKTECYKTFCKYTAEELKP